MKDSLSDSPRFTCRVARGCVAVFGDTTGGEPRGPGAAHVAVCADCQVYFAACNELDAALTRGATHAWQEAPSRLEQDIMRAVRQSAPVPRESRRIWFALAGTATAAVVTLVVFQRQFSFSPAIGDVNTPKTAEVSAQQLWTTLEPSAGAVIDGEPLNNEVDAVVSDARTAVHFLALNFLPTPPASSNSGE